MSWIFLGIGLVLVIEGLVLALAPSRIDGLLAALRSIPPQTRRVIGLGAVALGVLLVYFGKALGL